METKNKIKKIAVAVAAALLAGSAAAADVTLYGVVDTGFSYTNTRSKVEGNGTSSKFGPQSDKQTQSTKSFSMDSGNSAGSRWGLKGSEDLGNGLKVGFKLESGFSSDTGKGSDDGLFNRESSISLSGSFGTIYAGRMGSLISDVGSVGWYGSMASPFGSGWGKIAGHEAVMHMQGRKNNTLVYMSPRFSGLQFSAQYSMGDEGKENKPSTDRYAAIGVDYQVGGLEIGFLVDWMNKDSSELNYGEDLAKLAANYGADTAKIDKDAWTINLAANYDCGFAKTFIAAQYFKNTSLNQSLTSAKNQIAPIAKILGIDGVDETKATEDIARLASAKGFGVNLGVDVPAFGGNAMLSVGYEDADLRIAKRKVASADVYSALAGYTYPISKRTSVYAGAGYTYNKLKASHEGKITGSGKIKGSVFQAMAGLKHTF